MRRCLTVVSRQGNAQHGTADLEPRARWSSGAPAPATGLAGSSDPALASRGRITSPPRDEVLLQTPLKAEVREIIDTRYLLFWRRRASLGAHVDAP